MRTPYRIVRMKHMESIATSRSGRGGKIEAVIVIVVDALLKYSAFNDLSYCGLARAGTVNKASTKRKVIGVRISLMLTMIDRLWLGI